MRIGCYAYPGSWFSTSQISRFIAQSGPMSMSVVARSTIEFTISTHQRRFRSRNWYFSDDHQQRRKSLSKPLFLSTPIFAYWVLSCFSISVEGISRVIEGKIGSGEIMHRIRDGTCWDPGYAPPWCFYLRQRVWSGGVDQVKSWFPCEMTQLHLSLIIFVLSSQPIFL